ncbi:MAG: hypothetical protein RIA08_00815 [Roseovarius sp.]|uniref:hypothetical protein n=1 Tax=Roseovarius sp. TaxID=1486281 RepID=UPI0032EBFE99
MTKFVVLSKTNPHLPHDSVELQSPPPEDALNDDVAQKNAERYISQLMLGERGQRPDGPATDTAETAQKAPQAKGAKALPPLEAQEELDEEQRLRAAFSADEDEEVEEPRASLLSRLRARHVGIAALVLTAFFWPVLLGAAVLVMAWFAVLAILSLRYLVTAGHWHRFARRRPKTAERLRRAIDRAALRLDTVLDYLPDSLAESLALPDMSQPVAKTRPAARHGGMRTS